MRTRAFNLATLVSAIAAAVLAILWLRSLSARDRVALPIVGRYCVVTTFPHHLYLDCDPGWPGMRGSVTFRLPQYPASARYLELRLVPRTAGAWSLAVPIWLPLLFASAGPLASTVRFVARLRRRRNDGLCPACGYDLRASPDCCLECGRSSHCMPVITSR